MTQDDNLPFTNLSGGRHSQLILTRPASKAILHGPVKSCNTSVVDDRLSFHKMEKACSDHPQTEMWDNTLARGGHGQSLMDVVWHVHYMIGSPESL